MDPNLAPPHDAGQKRWYPVRDPLLVSGMLAETAGAAFVAWTVTRSTLTLPAPSVAALIVTSMVDAAAVLVVALVAFLLVKGQRL
jgi:hypothetical protein